MRAIAPYAGKAGSGEAQEIEVVELPDPQPAAGEVLVDVAASALNRADLLQMRGLYPPPAGASPVPGLECSGTVAAVGEGVDEQWVGREVMALLAGGGHATRVCVPEGQLLLVPEGLSLTEAGGVPEVALTSWTNLVYEGRVARGEHVLITGAASGVGTFAVQLARELGAVPIVAGRSLDRLERLRELGAAHCVELGEDLPAAVRELTGGRGVDLVIDLVGGSHFQSFLQAMASRARLVVVGVLAGPQTQINLGWVLRQRLEIRGSALRSRSLGEKQALVSSFQEFAQGRFATGALRPIIDREMPLEEAAAAYATMAGSGLFGKLLLTT